MSRKKKELPILEKVTITDVAAEGKALARVNDLVVFVPYVVPGDVVDLQVKRKKNHYAEAVAVKFHEYSSKGLSLFANIMGYVADANGNAYLMKNRFNINNNK